MTRRSRILAAVFALLHLTVAALGPIADARLEAAEQQLATHVESERQQPCATGHDHLFCQICRVIGISGNAPAAPVALQQSETVTVALAEPRGVAVSSFILLSQAPRAPPVA
jgi:hypothetical protein